MRRASHYVPAISRQVVCALYHEAKRHRKPMTRLVDELLTSALKDTVGWQIALTTSEVQEPSVDYCTPVR